ncbi:hypothetical protein HBH64_195330 [Parastagonospora nodorum]|nr:hypothetical protein HBH52_028790 [Parastagonospora nodorum]KAH4067199.1 hypothetical protein HBH50_136900 [Parastagonospora nodorum]KAH4085147.1 hypothetical protein HBH48_157060 [Parastagonospora nodorum]KAH4176212.1 hypothetical protein HBH43_055270 [Parastagonospora nodorum]KAH4310281.1 hypothetical protein HBI01_029320 [Parastagonospora nodorum]
MADATRAVNLQSCASDRPTGDKLPARVDISPPPLRRQRSGPERTIAGSPRTSALPAHLALHQKDVPHRYSEFAPFSKPANNEPNGPPHNPERSRCSLQSSGWGRLLPCRLSDQEHLTEIANTPGPQNRTLCRVCLKSAKVTYDPLVYCNGCQRCYHDSCCKPSPAEGADMLSWRCFKCLGIETKDASRLRRSLLEPIGGSTPVDSKAATKGWLSALQENIVPQPELSKPQKARAHIDELAALVKPPVHTQNGASISLDGCAEDQDNADESVCLRTPAKIFFETKALDSVDFGALEEETIDQELLEEAVLPSNTPNEASMCQLFNVEDIEVLEVPNTPTQRSSQLYTPEPMPILHSGADSEATSPDDSSLLIEPKSHAKVASTTAFCSICQTQRVLAKKGSTEVLCQTCHERSIINKSEKTEIPDTPEASTSNQTYERSKRPVPVEVAPTSDKAADQGPLHWFQTSLVAGTPKTKQKKMLTRKLNSKLSVTTNHKVAEILHRADVSSRQTPKKQQLSGSVQRQEISKPRSFGDSHSRTKYGSDQSISSVFSATKDNSSSTPVPADQDSDQDSDQDRSSALNSEPETKTRSTKNSTSPQVGTTSPNGDDTSIADRPAIHNGMKVRKRYTNRQLARIALVAANGHYMTKSQIVLWLVSTFPHLRVGEGNWEVNVRSALSWFEEFQGRNIKNPGTHGNKKHYGFSNATFRAQFEAEYSEFLDSPEPRQMPVPLEPVPSGDGKPRSKRPLAAKRAAKTAPSLLKPMVDHRSGPNMVDSCEQPSSTAKQAANDPSFNPFKRSVPRQAFKLPDIGNDTGLESFMIVAISPASQPTIDTMAQEKKARKIEEIKARPSRKTYFGSGQRLAHKRRYNLVDIHEERDGAWQAPARTAVKGLREADHNMDIDDDGTSRTLREVFNLPYNMIPVNDGQTELAFKDGEKGKRSRTMFRVGKMFGGELTVRTS